MGMSRPKLLDLFCCEGGASMGYHRAGFDVYGVDIFKDFNKKRYPFAYHQGWVEPLVGVLLNGGSLPFRHKSGDIERLQLADFAAVAASPPCQRYSITNAARQADYPDLVGVVRLLLKVTRLPYVIENVVGAPLESPVELCGCMFDLKARDDDGIMLHLQRTRLFESNMPLVQPEHDHTDHEWVGGCYGGARRDKYEAKYVRKGGYVPRNKKVVEAYMGIDWMTWKGLHQSIPPAYTKFIGLQLRAHIDNVRISA
jgi:DNA (cytosine-5)-methyltransferase 1